MTTTFEAIVYAVLHGVGEFLPLGTQALHSMLAELTGWAPPSVSLVAALYMGSSLALLVYFRHDWASMISSVIQMVIFRKKPMTMDERIPLFVGLSTLPVLAVALYFGPSVQALEWNTWRTCAVLAGTSLVLGFFDYWSRKIKNFYDWNAFDALGVGVVVATALFPGWDRLSALLLGAFLMNYKRDAGLKYAYFVLFPLSAARAMGWGRGVVNAGVAESAMSGVQAPLVNPLWVAGVLSFFVSLLMIGFALKWISQNGIARFMWLRVLGSAGVIAFLWFRGGF